MVKSIAAKQAKPSIVDVRRIQGLTFCDEKTVKKALTFGPETIRGIAGDRIAAAMVELGIVALNAKKGSK